MKLKIRQDGLYDIEIRGMKQLSCSHKLIAKMIREYGVSKKEFEEAMLYKNAGDNVLHFGDINKTFMFSAFEPDFELKGNA